MNWTLSTPQALGRTRVRWASCRARWLSLAIVPLACALFTGCGGAGAKSAAASVLQVKLRITPAADTNDRLPCYVLVRRVDPKAYVADSYQSVASMVMTPDDSVVASAVVFPGRARDFALVSPANGQLAVYVLFTYPSGDWKTLLPTATANQFEIKLAASRLYPPSTR